MRKAREGVFIPTKAINAGARTTKIKKSGPGIDAHHEGEKEEGWGEVFLIHANMNRRINLLKRENPKDANRFKEAGNLMAKRQIVGLDFHLKKEKTL